MSSPAPLVHLYDETMEEHWVAAERQAAIARHNARRQAHVRRRRRARIRRNRLLAFILLLLTSGVSYEIAGAFASTGPLHTTLTQTTRWRVVAQSTYVVPGRLARYSWPTRGEGAVGLQGAGVMSASPNEQVVPIASMTKMMTALVLLADHPLSVGEAGPTITMTPFDANEWVADVNQGDATVAVRAGEQLSELQMLQGLMIPSGDNVADDLARWDAGSLNAFVAKMNLRAAEMGLSHTHYADASGVAPGSASTAADQVRVVGALMENPVVRSIVDLQSAPFPVVGTIHAANPALGIDGIIGVKSGWTTAANGCLAVAAMDRVRGRDVMLIAVTTGNLDGLYGAARVDEQLISEERQELVPLPVAAYPAQVHLALTGSTQSTTLVPRTLDPNFVAWPSAKIVRQILVPDRAATTTGPLLVRENFATATGSLGIVHLLPAASAGGNR